MKSLTSVRRQLDRPLVEHERRALTATFSLVLAGAAVLLVLTRPTKPAAAITARRHPSFVVPRMAVSPVLTAPARTTVETFIRGFLDYTYGRGRLGEVHDATSALLASLAKHPERVPPGLRARQPRVIRVLAVAAPAGVIEAAAIVSDEEDVDYRISLVLAISRGRELVAGVEP